MISARNNEESPAGLMAERLMNLRGLKCPLPALRTRKALAGLAAGDVLVVECTDPLAAIDIPNLINQTGDVLEKTDRAVAIRRGATAPTVASMRPSTSVSGVSRAIR